MKNIGPIQSEIVAFLREWPDGRGHIGQTTQHKGFGGLDIDQVERSLDLLIARGIVFKHPNRFYRLEKMRGNLDDSPASMRK